MEEYEKYRLYLLFTEKAKLHLRSVLITDELSSEEYRPREDDLKKAELCLKNAPLHEKKLPDQANNYMSSPESQPVLRLSSSSPACAAA